MKLEAVKEQLSKEHEQKNVYLALFAYLREIMWKGNAAIIQKFCQVGLFETISKFFSASDHEDLMKEISWILTNLTSSEDKEVLDHIWQKEFGLLQLLYNLIHSSNYKLKEHGFWCCANLSSEKEQEKIGEFIKLDILPAINEVIEEEKVQMGLLRVISWTLSSLNHYKYKTGEFCQISVEMLSSLLFIIDSEVVADAIYGLKHLTEIELNEETEKIKFIAIAEAAIIPKLLSFIKPGDPLISPAIRTIGNISSASEWICENQIVDAGWFMKGKSNVFWKPLTIFLFQPPKTLRCKMFQSSEIKVLNIIFSPVKIMCV